MAASPVHPEIPAWGRVRPQRRFADRLLKILCAVFTGIGIFVLGWILGMLLFKGLSAFSPALFTEVTPGPGSEGGGLANAIVGTFLAEYGKNSALANVVRFINDILLSAPSILIGLFVYTIMVQPLGGYSGWAGGVALAIIATPVIVRTTEDMLRLVPGSLREAGAALGAPMAQVITSITWRAARAGIVTGIVLAMARIAGETAPLLFTALNNNFWFSPSLFGGVSNLPVTIFQFAVSPYTNWQQLAWAGALLITLAILGLSIAARYLIRKEPSR
jgi:phosphate transport system permease protein